MVNKCGYADSCLDCPLTECIYDTRTKERKRAYYKEHKEEHKERVKAWKSRNKDKCSEYVKRYAMTHDRTDYYKEYYRRKKENALATN